MNKRITCVTTIFLILTLTAILHGEETINCIGEECINIFSPKTIEYYSFEFSSTCTDDDTLFYPSKNEDSVTIRGIRCRAGCAEDRCNLQNDANQNGQLEREEILEAAGAHVDGKMEEIVFLSLLNYWRKQ